MENHTCIDFCNLKKREQAILALTVVGQSAKESGRYLNISYRTIEKYLELIKFKLGVNCKRDLISQALLSENNAQLISLAKKIMNEQLEKSA